jgi:hypothetical protein
MCQRSKCHVCSCQRRNKVGVSSAEQTTAWGQGKEQGCQLPVASCQANEGGGRFQDQWVGSPGLLWAVLMEV